MYEEYIGCVDPFTRQTFQSADLKVCSDKHLKFFPLDIDDDKSWIELRPQKSSVTGAYLLRPTMIAQQIKHALASSQVASIFLCTKTKMFGI